MRSLWIGLWVLCIVALCASQAQGQRRGWGSKPSTEIGVRGGFDYDIDAWSAGGQFRLPFAKRGRLQFAPSGDVFFTQHEIDWQANADLIYSPGPRGGFYFGGGMAFSDRPGIAERGVNRMVGLRLSPRFYIESRWTSLEGRSLYRMVVGYNISLGKRRDSAPGIFDARVLRR